MSSGDKNAFQAGQETSSSVRRERLDIDPQQPPSCFLIDGAGRSQASLAAEALLRGPPVKPDMSDVGGTGVSSTLSAIREFLASASSHQAPDVSGACDPCIERVKPTVKMPGEEGQEEGTEEADPHVAMDLSLGVFDVNGCVDPLLRQSVP